MRCVSLQDVWIVLLAAAPASCDVRVRTAVVCTLMWGMQAWPAEEHAVLSAAATTAALHSIQAHLPLHVDAALTATAHDMLLLCHYIPAPAWRLALALCLAHQPHLQQVQLQVRVSCMNKRNCGSTLCIR